MYIYIQNIFPFIFPLIIPMMVFTFADCDGSSCGCWGRVRGKARARAGRCVLAGVTTDDR